MFSQDTLACNINHQSLVAKGSEDVKLKESHILIMSPVTFTLKTANQFVLYDTLAYDGLPSN